MILFIALWVILFAHNTQTFERAKSASDLTLTKKRAARLKPSALPQKPKSCPWTAVYNYIVKPISIKHITSEIVSTEQGSAIAYEATLYNGNQITCFSLIEGQYAGEKWALLYQKGYEPVPIPSENFDLVHNAYNNAPNRIPLEKK